MNRASFYAAVRRSVFAGSIGQSQVDGMEAILDAWQGEAEPFDDRWLAYMLATVYHETAATMQPVRETLAASDDKAVAILDAAYRRGRLPWVSDPYWRYDADGKSWLGRGFVQLTHKRNYYRLSAETGVDLVAEPGRALEMDVAIRILFAGMRKGLFTGRRLADYFDGARADWLNARKIINGLDRAAIVAGHGRNFHVALRAAMSH